MVRNRKVDVKGLEVKKRYENLETGEVKYGVEIDGRELKLYLSEINTKYSITKLAKYGLVISQQDSEDTLNDLINIIRNSDLECIYTTSRVGIVGSEIIHPLDNKVVIDCDSVAEENYIKTLQAKGTIYNWKEDIFDSYIDDAKAQFYIASSFASVTLNHLKVQPFLVEVSGLTTSGKSTLVKICATVWGNPENAVMSWNATAISLERRAAYCGIFPLLVDDTKNADPSNVEKIIYNFSEGRSRERATATGIQTTRSWHNILLSSGEFSVFELAKNAGGIAARCISLKLEDVDKGVEFYDKVYKCMEHNYGHAGYEFLQYWREEIKKRDNTIIEEYEKIVSKLSKLALNAVSKRLARSFGAIILTAEILKKQFDFKVNIDAFYDLFNELNEQNNETDFVREKLAELLEVIDTERDFDRSYYIDKEGTLLLPVNYINKFLGANKNVIRPAWMKRGFSKSYVTTNMNGETKEVDYKKHHTVDKYTGRINKPNVVGIPKSVIEQLDYDFS